VASIKFLNSVTERRQQMPRPVAAAAGAPARARDELREAARA